MQKNYKFSADGVELELTLGKVARQADGAAWLKSGDNVTLTTIVASKKEKEFMGFLPLTVEYRERMSAAGKIPGGYFKREGKLSDREVLSSRLIDRSIRPLFPTYYFNEMQLISTVFSSDGQFPSEILSLIGSSIALTLSGSPFQGPIGAVKAIHFDNKWHFNTSFCENQKGESEIIIAGTEQGITMVEGHTNEITEEDLVELLFDAHKHIIKQVAWQKEIIQDLGLEQINFTSSFDWQTWEKRIQDELPDNFIQDFFTATKAERDNAITTTKEQLITNLKPAIEQGEVSESIINFLFNQRLKKDIPRALIANKKRLDGRAFDQVRPLYIEVATLPCVHGSSIFQRGETQALASVTLGTAQDAQKVDTLHEGTIEREFMLHYNFPPFSTGEIRPIRGVGRREVGHGFLAERSFLNVLPSNNEFPYTIRSVIDVLESNGSSSMATVCSTTMAMMDAGVPLKKMVSGIAMGLIQSDANDNHIISDILGIEDAFGLMDFKVTGTDDGITAIQMDIKAEAGLSKDILIKALKQAQKGRMHILAEMKKIMDTPRSEVSPKAPRVLIFQIPQEKIGAVIGPSGKTIKEIIAKTETEIDINDDGTVKVYALVSQSAEKAGEWIKILAGDIKIGSVFNGLVKRVAEFGLFVELAPGKDGLIHISMISRDRQRTLAHDIKVNDRLNVKIIAYDKETGRIRLEAKELKKPRKHNGNTR